MSSITIPVSKSTFVTTEDIDKNYSDYDFLNLEYVEEKNFGFIRSNILMKFDVNDLSFNVDALEKVNLVLFMRKTNKTNNSLQGISVYRNIEDFDINTVTYRTKPKTCESEKCLDAKYIKACCDKEMPCSKCKIAISLDITDLIRYWVSNGDKNFGLTIKERCLGTGFIIDSSKTECTPRLDFIFKDNTSKRLLGAQFQVQKKSGEYLDNNDNVIFNTALSNTSNGILYNMRSGEITFFYSGSYYLNWWIGIGGSGDITSMVFALQDNEKTQTIISASEIIIAGQVCGNALLNITTVPRTFKICNFSGGFVQYSIVPPVQADLTIISLN